jgi:hypothetical protein
MKEIVAIMAVSLMLFTSCRADKRYYNSRDK